MTGAPQHVTPEVIRLVEVVMNRCACLVFALILAAVPALANIPFPDLCVLDNPVGTDGATVFTLPNGAGAAFTNAKLAGSTVDATLTLTVVNSDGNAIADYPAEDMWLVSTAGGLVTCGNAVADAATDVNGMTVWQQPLNGGGHSLTEDAQAIIFGDPVPNTAAVHFVSADINGDLTVNLSDITVFTQALSVYNAIADFNNDGVVNLSDITLMTQGIGTTCP
ncbi:MAG TPA: hypothetical protein PLL30_12175 [Candidatus Krumholzibacteria bacterium]|nr:hypothetical protein [Candidatus Krumholzibacteria bacterium]HRY40544.1 hypothetical protein [Candidatus Krumholzibacteria bacterium]